jgi:hydroxylamine dehydrogenase
MKHSLLDLESETGKLSLGGIGGGMLLAGTMAIAGWRRSGRKDR